MSRKCTLAVVNCILGCIRKSVASRKESDYSFLWITSEVISGVPCPVLDPSYTRVILTNCDKSIRGPPSWLGLEHTLCKEKLEELGLFSLEVRNLTVCNYLVGACREGGAELFSTGAQPRNVWQQTQGDSSWILGKLFHHEVVKHCNKFPREAVKFPSSE